VKELIRKILKEYTEPKPILVYEIVINGSLNEGGKLTFIRKLRKLPPPEVILFKNKHSQLAIGSFGIQRIDPDEIDKSLREPNVTETIISSAERILKQCDMNCSLNVVDYSVGFDYHMWLNQTETGNVQLIINTSISHPKHLFHSKSSPLVIIYQDGEISTKNI
jgi:hypothetical protein